MPRAFRRVGVIGGVLATLAIVSAVPASAAVQHTGASTGTSTSVVASQVAAQSGDFIGTGINIRKDPRLNGTIVGQGNQGDGFTYVRGGTGDVVVCPTTGWHTADWWLIENDRTGARGWISACFGTR